MTKLEYAQPIIGNGLAARSGPTAQNQFKQSPMASLRGVVAQVRAFSEEGELPLFVWGLGLSQVALVQMLDEVYLPSESVAQLDSGGFSHIERLTPRSFHEIRLMLFQRRTRLVDRFHADLLARAIAGACFGNRPLWQDIGLSDEEALNSFIRTFFAPLAQKHRHCRNWKRQLLKDLYGLSGAEFSISDLLLKCVLTHH
jgi:nitrogen fixation protein NifQ